MKQLKAFTLIELLIGMILSGIVIAFCYGAYTLIHSQFLSFKEIKNELKISMQFNALLSTDFYQADLITWQEQQLTCSGETSPVIYNFRGNDILRTLNENCDTFKLPNTEPIPIYLFPGKSSAIRAFRFSTSVLDEKEVMHYAKDYSSSAIIKLEFQQPDKWE